MMSSLDFTIVDSRVTFETSSPRKTWNLQCLRANQVLKVQKKILTKMNGDVSISIPRALGTTALHLEILSYLQLQMSFQLTQKALELKQK